MLFVLSAVAAPQAGVVALQEPDISATPVIEGTETPGPGADDVDSEADPEGESTPDQNANAEKENEVVTADETGDPEDVNEPDDGEDALQTTNVGTTALIEGGYSLANLSWDDQANQVAMDLQVDAGFSADAGDNIVINYLSDALVLAPEQSAPAGLPVSVAVDSSLETVTLTFTEDFEAPVADSFVLVLVGELRFQACLPNPEPYTNSVYLNFWSANEAVWLEVRGEECPAAEHPAVDNVEFLAEMDAIMIDLYIPNIEAAAGFTATITFPQDKLNIPNGSTADFYFNDPQELYPPLIATAVANDGLITITFLDAEYEVGDDSRIATGWMHATLEPVVCDIAEPGEIVDTGQLYFVANPGGTFRSYFVNEALCDGASTSKTGELSADGSEIIWTIDSGDLINGGSIREGMLSTTMFDCESIDVQLIPNSSQVWHYVDCFGPVEGQISDSFTVQFGGEGPVRAIVTVTSPIEEGYPFTSAFNCAEVSATGPVLPTALNTRDNNAGWGTSVCAEVHLAGGGDTISNNVSSPAVYPGDPLTYTVNFSTTADFWLTISLEDVLPDGFDVTDVTCTFTPASLAEGECEVSDDNSLTVGLSRDPIESEEGPDLTGGGEIALTIEGTVSAAPGTELVSQACGARGFDLPLFPPVISQIGGDGICASTTTLVLQPEEPTTPTPSSTPEPTAPTTPEPTGTVEPDPTETTTPDPTGTVEPEPTETPAGTATPEVTTPATPGATPGSPTDPATDPDPESDDPGTVTGLPSTGQGSTSAGIAVFTAAIAASMLMAVAVGIRIRSPRS